MSEAAPATRDDLITRLALTPATLADALRGHAADDLARRPAERAWSAVEIVCHLRDVEELFRGPTPSIFAPWRIGGPLAHPFDPDRWAEDRQYRRHDAAAALAAFRRRRAEVLTLLRALTAEEWTRRGVHLRSAAPRARGPAPRR